MKLCRLLHENHHRCPTCGQTIGRPGASELVFPDSEGYWDIDGKKYRAEDFDDPNKTQEFDLDIPTKLKPEPKRRRKLDNHPGMLQAVLRYQAGLDKQIQQDPGITRGLALFAYSLSESDALAIEDLRSSGVNPGANPFIPRVTLAEMFCQVFLVATELAA